MIRSRSRRFSSGSLGLSGSGNRNTLDPTHLSLHKVYGELVWVASMVGKERGDKTDNDHPSAEDFQGVGVLRALNADGSKVIVDRSKSTVFAGLKTQIATGSNNNSPESAAKITTIEGTLHSVSQPLTFNGNTVIIFTMEGDGDHLYRGQLGEEARKLTMAVAKPGDKVIISFVDSNEAIREITSFTDVALAGVK